MRLIQASIKYTREIEGVLASDKLIRLCFASGSISSYPSGYSGGFNSSGIAGLAFSASWGGHRQEAKV